jgi:prepilin-type N-terminal cleavage/methylation domain-containing protein
MTPPRSVVPGSRWGGCRDAHGVSLAELVVVMAIFAIVAVGVLAVWQQGQTAYFVGSEQAEVQGDARVAIDQMARDLRKAGRDVIQCAFDSEAYTQCSGAKLTRCQGLLGGGFTCNDRWIIPAASSTSTAMTMQVQMDLDGDGLIDTSAPSEESVTYAWTSANKQITRQQGTGTARVLADNITSLGLVFEGRAPSNGVCTGTWGAITPTSQTARDCIQRVTISLVASGSVGQFAQSGVATVQRTLRTTVDLRTR